MRNKIVTITLSIILFVVPILIIPSSTTTSYSILKMIVLLACGFVLLITTLSRGKHLKFDATDILLFIFGLLSILSTIFSQNIHSSLFGAKNRHEGVFIILTYILIYYNAKYYFKNYKNIINIALFIYSSICIFAVVQFYVGSSIALSPIFGKGANGTFGNQNFMGSFVSIILPAFILGYIFKGEKKFLIASIFGFCALVLCLTRSAWVAFIVSALFVLLCFIIKGFNKSNKNETKTFFKRFIVLAISFALCFAVIYFTQGHSNMISKKINITASELKEASQTGITEKMGSLRIAIWQLCLKVVCRYPILGCGVDALQYGLQAACPHDNYEFSVMHNRYIDKAHNEYLHIACTMGIPAAVIYLGAISLIFLPNFFKVLKDKKALILCTIILSYMTQAFFNISTIGIAPILWFILGIASKHAGYDLQ